MHEASLISALMNRIDDLAKAENAKQVTGVSVWLGALSHMTKAHFAEHFEQAATGSIAEGAQLDMTLSEDTSHQNAQDLVLESIEVET